MRQYMPEAAKNKEFLEGLANSSNPEFNATIEKIVLAMKAKGKI